MRVPQTLHDNLFDGLDVHIDSTNRKEQLDMWDVSTRRGSFKFKFAMEAEAEGCGAFGQTRLASSCEESGDGSITKLKMRRYAHIIGSHMLACTLIEVFSAV